MHPQYQGPSPTAVLHGKGEGSGRGRCMVREGVVGGVGAL